MYRKGVFYTLENKIIPLRIDVETYERIRQFVQWVNYDNAIEGNQTNYTVDEFIRGASLSQLEFVENFIDKGMKSVSGKSTFKNRFKEIAKERNVRQVDICNALEIEKSYLSIIFNNKHQPNAELFFKIWLILKCPPIHQTFYFED